MSARATTLSPRQKRVVEIASTGATDYAIAHELGMSKGTLRSHWSKIFCRLGVVNRTAACLAWAMKQLAAPIGISADSNSAETTGQRRRGKVKP